MKEEEHIQKGFNHGYQLQKHQPELAKAIQEGFADKQAPYAQGFIAGSQERTKENAKERSAYRPNLMKGRSSKSRDKGIDL